MLTQTASSLPLCPAICLRSRRAAPLRRVQAHCALHSRLCCCSRNPPPAGMHAVSRALPGPPEKVACKAGTLQPSLAPVQSQVNEEGEGDSRMFNFVRENPHEQGVDCIRRIDSKGHLCGEAALCSLAACSTKYLRDISVCMRLPQPAILSVARDTTCNWSGGAFAGLTFKSVSGQDLVNMQAAARHIF